MSTQLVNLMSDSTHWTRIVAYELAQKVAEEDIKRLIVEMELATSDLEQAYLPGALVSRLSSYDEENLEPFLLAWQLVLQLVDVSVSLMGCPTRMVLMHVYSRRQSAAPWSIN